jgi:DnaK suppressor protein
MDSARARELLAAERARIEESLRRLALDPSEEPGTADPADLGTDLAAEDVDDAVRRELLDELAALERAEERLGNGTYGLSVESGEPIPDDRLEIRPAAERTAAEQAYYDGRR